MKRTYTETPVSPKDVNVTEDCQVTEDNSSYGDWL